MTSREKFLSGQPELNSITKIVKYLRKRFIVRRFLPGYSRKEVRHRKRMNKALKRLYGDTNLFSDRRDSSDERSE